VSPKLPGTPAPDVFQIVVDHLREISSPKDRTKPITLDTEIYDDLHIHGHDLWELALWLHSQFGVEGPFYPAWYGPPETGGHLFRWIFGEKRGKYDSLTVRAVLGAIDAKTWPQ
jgi:hypothetical protein